MSLGKALRSSLPLNLSNSAHEDNRHAPATPGARRRQPTPGEGGDAVGDPDGSCAAAYSGRHVFTVVEVARASHLMTLLVEGRAVCNNDKKSLLFDMDRALVMDNAPQKPCGSLSAQRAAVCRMASVLPLPAASICRAQQLGCIRPPPLSAAGNAPQRPRTHWNPGHKRKSSKKRLGADDNNP